MNRTLLGLTTAALCIVWLLGFAATPSRAENAAETVTIEAAPSHMIRTFRPQLAIGSTVDKEPAGSIPSLYSRKNVRAMLDTGLGWLSYRLFTELSVQDWHWNPHGVFSAGDRGYWTSSASTATAPISDSFGYRLPHRGNTSDQGNNEDYSRLDDGNPATYWKSDPYLAHAFTGDPDTTHPQWVVVDLGSAKPVNAIRIAWVDPFAVDYSVAYWTGSDAMGDPAHGTWKAFPSGNVRNASHTAARKLLRLATVPVKARFVRISMTKSSNTCDRHGAADKRNCVGYAIGEIYVGDTDSNGNFSDAVEHLGCGGESPAKQRCGNRQTATYVSSTDPWHSAAARVKNQEQPGLDLIARSGLDRGIPAMYPVAMWYSTPQNAVAEVRYLRARGYPLGKIELGEEVDGQYGTPEDYGALYIQWARALHAMEPSLKLGGPVFSGVNSDLQWWPDHRANVSWLNRFLRYLKAHGAMNELSFMSFEHYPYDGCEDGAKLMQDLLEEPGLIASVARTWRADGLPAAIPMYVTEAGFSSVNFTETPMRIEGALWQVDYMLSALSSGVEGVVYYQYEPVPLSQNTKCPSNWGNLTIFDAGPHGTIRARAAQFYGMQMMMRYWVQPGNAVHELYAAKTNVTRKGLPLVTAYATKRPDGTWSILLNNKDHRTHQVAIKFNGASGATFAGIVTRVTFGSAQYVWHRNGANSLPNPNLPPVSSTLKAAKTYTIPAQSITVLKGSL